MKSNLKNSEELHQAIKEMEQKLDVQEVKMKDKYEQLKDNLQPKNVLKNSYSHLAETPELQRTLVNTLIGFALGFAFKKINTMMHDGSLHRLAENLVHDGLDKLENKDRHSRLSQAITMLRRNTPPDSALYQFVKYRDQNF